MAIRALFSADPPGPGASAHAKFRSKTNERFRTLQLQPVRERPAESAPSLLAFRSRLVRHQPNEESGGEQPEDRIRVGLNSKRRTRNIEAIRRTRGLMLQVTPTALPDPLFPCGSTSQLQRGLIVRATRYGKSPAGAGHLETRRPRPAD